MRVFTHHHHDIRSDAWRHASGRLIFYGHEPRLKVNSFWFLLRGTMYYEI